MAEALDTSQTGQPVPFPDPFELFGNKAVEMAKHLAGLPQQLMDTGMHYTQTGDAGPVTDASMDMAGALAGRTPFASPGTVGILGGRLAQGADLGKLADAQEMESYLRKELGSRPSLSRTPEIQEHALQDTLAKQTGWFRGPDGHWRFEIPDTDMHVLPRADKLSRDVEHTNRNTFIVNTDPIQNSVEHSPLYEAYPGLKNWSLTGYTGSDPNVIGKTWFENKTIGLDPRTDAGLKKQILAHELQHAVQDIEGFAPGTAGSQLVGVGQQASRNLGYNPDDPLIKEALPKVANRIYQRHAGEVEARNVQGRAVDPSKAGLGPWSTMDMSASRQIFPHTWLGQQAPDIQNFIQYLQGIQKP